MAISALRRLCVPFLLVAVTIALLALSSGDSSAQWVPNTPQFQPTFDAKLCNDLPANFTPPGFLNELKGGAGACVPVTTPSGNPDITTPFNVPQGHLAYDQALFITAGGANETRLSGAAMPGPNAGGQTGAPAGGLQSTVKLGLASNPCSNTIQPNFVWWESEYDITNTVACQPEGTDDRWVTLATDGGDAYNGVADRNSPVVTDFPSCFLKMFDPDRDGIDTDGNPATIGDQPVQPRARFAGLTQVPPGGDYQILQNFEFDAGALAAAFRANTTTTKHPYAKLDASLGYINVIQLNDPTTVILQPNPISDFCTALGTKGMLLGKIDTDNNGSLDLNRVTSPAAAGSYQVQLRTQSYRDADLDGLENNMDTCAWTANTPAQDPYTTSGPDTDMLDSVCDPAPAVKNDDQDGDGYLNSQDQCPLNSNPLPAGETDSENTVAYNTGAPDAGPPQDSIADDCDSEMGGNDTVSNGIYFSAIHVDSTCITGGAVVDADGDGWCLAQDPNDANANLPGQLTHVDVSSAVPADDDDGDGYTDLNEASRIRTDPGKACPVFKDKHDAWPPDFDMSRVINITDVVKVLPPTFGMNSANPAWDARRDLVPDNVINISDVVKVLPPVFGSSCTPTFP